MRKALLIISLLLAVIGLLWEFVPIMKTDWIGGFDLTVKVSSSGEPLSSVRCYVLRSHEEAGSLRYSVGAIPIAARV